MAQGAGRENLGDANTAKVAFMPVSASYGKISATRVQTTPFTFTLTNHTGSAILMNAAATRFDPTTGTVGAYGGGGDPNFVAPGQGERYLGGRTAGARVTRNGILAAVDMTTNRLVWRYRWLDQCYSGVLATGGGLLFVVPWCVFMIWTVEPTVMRSLLALEKFSETNNPGYFLIKIACLLLAVLALLQVVLDLLRPAKGAR